MYAPGGKRGAEARRRILQLQAACNIEQPANADRAVDDKAAQAAGSPNEACLQPLVHHAVHFGQVGKEIADPGAYRPRHVTIAVRHWQEERLVETCVEAIREAVEPLPWVIGV